MSNSSLPRETPPPPPALAKKWKQLKRSLSPHGPRPALSISDSHFHEGGGGDQDDHHRAGADWLHLHDQVIEEMTEAQEQEIYSIPQSELSHHTRAPVTKRNLLQRIALIRHNNNPNNQHGNNNNHNNPNNHHGNPVNSSLTSSNGSGAGAESSQTSSTSSLRLQLSYKLLEEEYCKLKFEQTELVALADQRKMEKARSAELMESLDEEIRTRRKTNLNLRLEREKLQDELEALPPVVGEKESNHELNSLWLQRDLADHKLQEARDALYVLRKENAQFLEELQAPPTIGEDVVRQEMSRLRKEARSGPLGDQLEQFKREVQRLRPTPKHQLSAAENQNNSMIGKEIVVNDEEDSAKDTVSVTSTLLSDSNKT